MLILFVQVLALNETRLIWVWVRDQEKEFTEKFSQSEILFMLQSL